MSKKDLGLGEAKLKRPMDRNEMGHEVAALDAMLKFMNDPNRQPAESKVKMEKPESVEQPRKTSPPPPPLPTTTTTPVPDRIFFTGRLKSGKDFLAREIGAQIIGLADPLYYLAHHFFGVGVNNNQNKDLPGMRSFLQTAGQWGRGTVNEQYPFTAARACFVTMIRSLASAGIIEGQGVDWQKYGLDDNLWIESALRRIDETAALSRIAITNVRFENEFRLLQERGFKHYHVMASPPTIIERLKKEGIDPNSPVLKDTSERLAAGLDANVTKQVSAQRNGPMIHCIWNDEKTPAISNRLYSTAQFKALFKQTEQQQIQTGE